MQVDKHKVVTIDYTLTDNEGNVLDQSRNGEFAYLHGADNIIPGLETALDGKETGEEVNVAVPPGEAYGEYNDALKQVVSKEMFPSQNDVEPGRQFHAQTPEGNPMIITVTDVSGDDVTIDANHPLAGRTLNFEVKVVDVREPSHEELEHGHVHGPGGHEHD